MSAILSFLVAVPSIIGTLSADTSTVAAVNSFKSRDNTPLECARPSPATELLSDNVTVPDVPPPDKPSPAVTPAISPLSAPSYTELPIPL